MKDQLIDYNDYSMVQWMGVYESGQRWGGRYQKELVQETELLEDDDSVEKCMWLMASIPACIMTWRLVTGPQSRGV